MKILHTSDWHLGFSMRERRLHEDQVHVVNQIIEMVRDHAPDVVLVAGDIYDRPVPPAPSMELFDDFVTTVGIDLKTPVLVIPGNHDSAERIGHYRRLLAATPIHLVGQVSATPRPLIIEDEFGPVEIFGLPYLYPAHVSAALGEEADIRDAECATKAMIDLIHKHSSTNRRVLVAHAFVRGGIESDSEQNMIGNVIGIPASLFDGFSYVALGHLHRAQHIESDCIQYSGSILKYSAREADYNKSVTLVEIGRDGEISSLQRLPLTPLRDLRVVSGRFEDILIEAEQNPSDDFIIAELDDQRTIPNAMTRIKVHYPNCLHLRPKFLGDSHAEHFARTDVRKRNLGEVFVEFWALYHEQELPGSELVEVFQEAHQQAKDERQGKDK